MKLPREIMDNKYLLDGLIIKMRYQNVDPAQQKNLACMTYTDIASIVGKSTTYCRSVCLEYIANRINIGSKRIMKSRSKKLLDVQRAIRPNKLNLKHIDHIISPDTLKRQIGMTLEERTADFTRVYSNKKISTSTLWNIYKKHRVRKKKVKVTKIPNRKESKKIKRSI